MAKKAKLTILQSAVLIIFLFAWSMKQTKQSFSCKLWAFVVQNDLQLIPKQ